MSRILLADAILALTVEQATSVVAPFLTLTAEQATSVVAALSFVEQHLRPAHPEPADRYLAVWTVVYEQCRKQGLFS